MNDKQKSWKVDPRQLRTMSTQNQRNNSSAHNFSLLRGTGRATPVCVFQRPRTHKINHKHFHVLRIASVSTTIKMHLKSSELFPPLNFTNLMRYRKSIMHAKADVFQNTWSQIILVTFERQNANSLPEWNLQLPHFVIFRTCIDIVMLQCPLASKLSILLNLKIDVIIMINWLKPNCFVNPRNKGMAFDLIDRSIISCHL